MDPLAYRVAARFLVAGLEADFTHHFEKLLKYAPDNPPPQEVKEFRKWISDHFKFTGRVPTEAKRPREELERFWRSLELAESPGLVPGVFPLSYGESWKHLRAYLPEIVKYLSGEGSGKEIAPMEKKVGGDTFINLVGASSARFDEMISGIEKVFSELVGWRKKALSGGVRVIFAGPKDFHGTASGTYRSETDELWIRATPGGKIQRAGSGYAGFDYVIVHELGHRYERKHHQPYDFDSSAWHTSRYSRKEGESFAELFALSNFNMTSQGGAEVLPRFEHLMTTGKMPAIAV